MVIHSFCPPPPPPPPSPMQRDMQVLAFVVLCCVHKYLGANIRIRCWRRWAEWDEKMQTDDNYYQSILFSNSNLHAPPPPFMYSNMKHLCWSKIWEKKEKEWQTTAIQHENGNNKTAKTEKINMKICTWCIEIFSLIILSLISSHATAVSTHLYHILFSLYSPLPFHIVLQALLDARLEQQPPHNQITHNRLVLAQADVWHVREEKTGGRKRELAWMGGDNIYDM